MSVYKHDYRAYTGRVTPLWTRVVVLARYGLAEVWSSKITIGLFTLSLLPYIVFLIMIYLANNPVARMIVEQHDAFVALTRKIERRGPEDEAVVVLVAGCGPEVLGAGRPDADVAGRSCSMTSRTSLSVGGRSAA